MSIDLDHETGLVRAEFHDAGDRVRDALDIGVEIDGVSQHAFRATGHDSQSVFESDALRLQFSTQSGSSIALSLRAIDGEVHEFTLAVRDNSNYYGCGERFNALNQKGFILPMVSIDRPEPKGVVTYKPVPFYMSTRGYGIWVDNAEPGTFDLNATDREHVILRYHCRELRVVLIDGPDFASMLDEFTRLAGRPRVPPMWSFSPWKSRDVHKNRDELLADAELTRKYDLPGSVIVIDSPWETGYNDFVLNETQFPDPVPLFARIRELGFYPCFWLTPFINSENITDMKGIDSGASRNFAEARERGYLVKQPSGEPMIASWWKGKGGLVDFTNPAAVAWWHDQLDKAKPWGFRAIKCDDGEGYFVQDAVFHDGSTRDAMKNRYAALYLQAAQEYVDERLDGDGVLLSRCGFTGTQRFPFGWAGDNEANFSFDNGLPGVILAAQNAALSGMPMWASDIAGYMGTPSKEVFIRWTQFGAFSPLMLVHMTSNLGPWDFDDETLAIYRKFAKLHTSLAPYLLEAAHEAAESGMPIIQPMVLAFPNDGIAAKHQFQYMFGNDLLVAPMFQSGTHRSVYLPELAGGGKWIDYWDGATIAGGQLVEVSVPLSRIPVFVRPGALLYRLPEDIDTLIPRHADMSPDVVALDARRVIQVWPGGNRSMETVDGVSAKVERANGRATLTLTSQAARSIEVQLVHVADNVTGENAEEWTRNTDGSLRRSVDVGPSQLSLEWPITWQDK